MARLEVDTVLLDQVKAKYPEIKGLTYTGMVEWLARKALLEA